MIRMRLNGPREAIHSHAAAIKINYPDCRISFQDSVDGMSARIDITMPDDQSLALFGGTSPYELIADRVQNPTGDDRTSSLLNWRKNRSSG